MLEFQTSKNIKKRHIKFKYDQDIEPQEALLDKLAQRREEELGLSGKRFEVPLSSNVLKGFWIVTLILLSFLFFKTFQLQIIQGKDYLARAQNNKFIISQIQAERGVIYDKNFNQLVSNEPAFDLVLNKANLPKEEQKKNELLNEISQILDMNYDDLKNKIASSTDSLMLIFTDIPQQALIILEAKIKYFSGFEIRQDWVRDYEDGQYFSHIIGYLGKVTQAELKSQFEYSIFDWAGRDGLEKTYENVLRKNSGKTQIEKDALGNEISRKTIEQPSSGNSLVLWLDADLQKKTTQTLENILKNIGSKNAAAVALDPKTGGVLAMVSIPNFDNNLFNKGSDAKALQKLLNDSSQPLFNLAISGQLPSGSAIKPLVALGALQEKIILPEKKINDDKGYISIPNPWDPNLPTLKYDWAVHGWTDMRKAIAESCNVYFYTIGGGYGDQKGLGAAKIKKYLELFGWGNKTQIDLPAEAVGFIPTPEWKQSTKGMPWQIGDTYNMSIGQGDVLVTPLQLAASFVPIANGGKLLQPQMVQKIVDLQKNTIEEFSPEIVRENFIDSQNIQIVREGMRQGVSGVNSPQASSILLNSLPVAAAAKTGTAETGKTLGGVKIYDNWITVFAPYNDPQIVLTLMFKDVKGLQGAALPAAKEILQWYFTEGGGVAK